MTYKLRVLQNEIQVPHVRPDRHIKSLHDIRMVQGAQDGDLAQDRQGDVALAVVFVKDILLDRDSSVWSGSVAGFVDDGDGCSILCQKGGFSSRVTVGSVPPSPMRPSRIRSVMGMHLPRTSLEASFDGHRGSGRGLVGGPLVVVMALFQ